MHDEQSGWFLEQPDVSIPITGLQNDHGELDPEALAEVTI
jgi:hypothetical protein